MGKHGACDPALTPPRLIPLPDTHYSGAILHSETLGQTAADGTPFPELLKAKGVLPGVKVGERADYDIHMHVHQ